MKSGVVKSIVLGLSCLALAGCNTVADYNPKTIDGQKYIYGMPVMATAKLESVKITEKDGTVHNFTDNASDVVGQGGVGVAAATTAGGLSSVQGGLAAGALSGVLDFFSRLSAPKIELMVLNDQGEVKPIPVNSDSLRILNDQRCLEIGDYMHIVKKGSRGFDIYNANPNLMRLSVFQPTCEELRKMYPSAEVFENPN